MVTDKDQLDEIVQAWQVFGDAMAAAMDALAEVWGVFYRAIREVVEELLNLPAWWRLWFYIRLRRCCQWIPERWAAFVACRCPLWLVKCL